MEPDPARAPLPAAWQRRLAAADRRLLARVEACDPLLLQLIALPLLDAARRGVEAGRRPLLLLNGPVGAGKSTLMGLLQALAPLLPLQLAVASIDDFYLPPNARRAVLAGNPFGVARVPPGSHDLPLLFQRLDQWRRSGTLLLPRFDKTLAGGAGDRAGEQSHDADALVLEGWLLGCRPIGAAALAQAQEDGLLTNLSPDEIAWLPRWDQALKAYEPLRARADGLALLRPQNWMLPYRWRLQAEARQRRRGGGWLEASAIAAMVRATLASLPPALYQDPLLDRPRLGAVELDGRRRCRRLDAQLSDSSTSSAIG